MTKPAKKAMIIGFDAPIVERVYDYAVSGELPNIGRCIANGVWAKNGMNPLPTVTPPNWTTLATGAWPSTHGITDFNIHIPGDPLDIAHMGFDSAEIQAEFLWSAIEKAGKQSIVLNWPSSWPPKIEAGWQVAGAGLSPNDWGHLHSPFGGGYFTLRRPMLVSNGDQRGAMNVSFAPAVDWHNLSAGADPLEAVVRVEFPRGLFTVEPVTWHVLALGDAGKGYARVIVSDTKDVAKALATLKPGEWSPLITMEFQSDQGPKLAGFRMKLVELSPDAKSFRLYVTGIAALRGFTKPDSLADELLELGELPFSCGSAFAGVGPGWYGLDTMVELAEMHDNWLAAVATHLLRTKEWSLFAMHNHIPDHFYHGFSNRIDPLYTPVETAREFAQVELALYRGIDRMVGRILECVDDDTVVVFVSDHGAKPSGRPFRSNKVLAAAGLLTYAGDNPLGVGVVHEQPGPFPVEYEHGVLRVPGGPTLFDWSKTMAYARDNCWVYVNLKGRDPEGTVDPADYEKVQEEIVDALYSYKDPETGHRPVLLALKKEDARFIGLWGDHVGDVVYAVDPRYNKEHAQFLPTARHGVGSVRSLFLITGAGVKRGEVLERNVWSQDVVPTLCYLTGWPVPAQCEGSVVYQALKDPNP